MTKRDWLQAVRTLRVHIPLNSAHASSPITSLAAKIWLNKRFKSRILLFYFDPKIAVSYYDTHDQKPYILYNMYMKIFTYFGLYIYFFFSNIFCHLQRVPFITEDLEIECEGKEKYKCGSNVFWKW